MSIKEKLILMEQMKRNNQRRVAEWKHGDRHVFRRKVQAVSEWADQPMSSLGQMVAGGISGLFFSAMILYGILLG